MLVCLSENLFGKYLEKGMILEKRGLASVADPDSPTASSNRYVMADITSFFTLLVGIYFPSVTGQHQTGPQGRRLRGTEDVLTRLRGYPYLQSYSIHALFRLSNYMECDCGIFCESCLRKVHH